MNELGGAAVNVSRVEEVIRHGTQFGPKGGQLDYSFLPAPLTPSGAAPPINF
jgi:hypothetical protein